MNVCFVKKKNLEQAANIDLDLSPERVLHRQEDNQYAVILHNDPVNGVDFVVKVIRSVFAYPLSKAVRLMLQAHFSGRSTLWVGSQNKAQEKRSAMIAHGPDPNRVEHGAQPLTVTIEWLV